MIRRLRVGTLAIFTFREAVRKRVVPAAIGLTLLLIVLFGVGIHFFVAGFDSSPRTLPSLRSAAIAQMLLMGLWFGSFLSGLLAIFVSVGTIAAEIEAGTLQVIVPKPLARWEIVVGKWLGIGVMLAIHATITAGAMILIVYLQAGFVPPQPALGVALMAFQVLVLLSLAIFGSTFLQPLANGVVVLTLYVIAMMGGMVEQMGSLIENETMKLIGVISGTILPTDVVWRSASSYLQPRVLSPVNFGGPFSGVQPASEWMLVYAGLYLAAVILGGCLVLGRRDL